jgi:XRE family transcriptional regulator, regulator of sulfur utilization
MWNDTVMTPPEETDARGLARLVGARVGQLRRERGWSLSSLAKRAGLGKATLSEIEAGQRNPTLETLYAIAAQLQIGLAELLLEDGSPTASAPVVRGEAVEGTLVAVYHDPSVTTEIYRLRILPGRRQVSPGHGAGVVEHLLITAGAISAGPLDEPVELAAGDDWTWEPTGAHGYAAIGNEAAEAVLIMRHPRP